MKGGLSMEEKTLYSTTSPCVVHKEEICEELVKIATKEKYPIQKAKWNNSLEKFVGFSPEYMITADKLPPIPGGWQVEIRSFEKGYHEMLVTVKSEIDENGKEVGTINKFVIQMLEEFRKEGLEVVLADEYDKVYGSLAKKVKAWGHPLLIDKRDEFIENMR